MYEDGKSRPLHLEQAFKSIDYELPAARAHGVTPRPSHDAVTVIDFEIQQR